jgi:hypothetical protein
MSVSEVSISGNQVLISSRVNEYLKVFGKFMSLLGFEPKFLYYEPNLQLPNALAMY